MNEKAPIGFKVIDEHNVLEPDPIMEMLATMTADGAIRPAESRDFVRNFAKIDVEPHVPYEVRRGFLFARNAMCYAYWCYGLMTLGAQQLLRVGDDALTHALAAHGINKDRMTFADRIKKLVAIGAIPPEDSPKWDAVRRLRNSATHQKFQQIFSPADAFRLTTTIAALLARVSWHSDAQTTEAT